MRNQEYIVSLSELRCFWIREMFLEIVRNGECRCGVRVYAVNFILISAYSEHIACNWKGAHQRFLHFTGVYTPRLQL